MNSPRRGEAEIWNLILDVNDRRDYILYEGKLNNPPYFVWSGDTLSKVTKHAFLVISSAYLLMNLFLVGYEFERLEISGLLVGFKMPVV